MRIALCFYLVIQSLTISAQYDHESVFENLDGDVLRDALIDNYKTSTVLTYSEARDTFFRNIDAVNNVLECVYTGFKVNLDPNADPTEDAFSKGINTEHTYPRSKGASENTNAYSDMHHLFPTRERANSDRGSLPFQEIIDSQTDKWYFEENITTNIPSQGIDNYSELLTNSGFEPREKHKGDVARAYFYFYTMYKDQADQAAPNFFGIQQETMCQWHFEDKVDEKEWTRNEKIAPYQDGKKNPFILDCRLARLYCDDMQATCTAVSTKDIEVASISLRPNPVHGLMFLDIASTNAERYTIISSEGSVVSRGWLENDKNSATIPTESLKGGFYIVRVFDNNGHMIGVSKFVKI